MKERMHWEKKFIIGAVVLLSLVFIVPRAGAQFIPMPWYNPFFGFAPIGYYPILPPAPPLLALGISRYACAPVTTSLFPAPTLPIVPAATLGGVGVTPLIPTVPVTIPLPVSTLVTTPLSPLITYTPLSLVGLTFAPVPVTAAPPPAPLIPILPAVTPTATTTVTAGTATTAAIISLLSALLI